MKNTAIEALSANVINTRFEDLDTTTVETAKNRIIDVLGCLIGGANAPGNEALIRLTKKWGGAAESSIFISGGKVPAQHAAMVNTIMARSYDFEVMSISMGDRYIASHHAATHIPTALALGENAHINGKELITAMMVGDDLAARVAVAAGSIPIYIGWDGCGTLSHLGATAIAGRLLGLNERQLRHAFGIVLNLTASAIQSLWDGATTFKLGQGAASRNGIFSAELAKENWTGVEDALLSRFGFYHLYTSGCQEPDFLTKDLGKRFYGEANFKRYPCGMPTHTVIDCALGLVENHEIKPDDIAEIVITVPRGALENSYYAKPFQIREFPHGDAIFSYPYVVASAFLKKSVTLENFTEQAIQDPQVLDLTNRTKMIEPEENRGMSVGIEVRMKSGQTYSDFRQPNRDWVQNPVPREKVEDKFRFQVRFSKTVSEAKSEQLLETLENLEEIEDVNEIINLMVL